MYDSANHKPSEDRSMYDNEWLSVDSKYYVQYSDLVIYSMATTILLVRQV